MRDFGNTFGHFAQDGFFINFKSLKCYFFLCYNKNCKYKTFGSCRGSNPLPRLNEMCSQSYGLQNKTWTACLGWTDNNTASVNTFMTIFMNIFSKEQIVDVLRLTTFILENIVFYFDIIARIFGPNAQYIYTYRRSLQTQTNTMSSRTSCPPRSRPCACGSILWCLITLQT